MMLDALKLEPRCDVRARLRAFDDYAQTLESAGAVAIAKSYRTFYDAPWNARHPRLECFVCSMA